MSALFDRIVNPHKSSLKSNRRRPNLILEVSILPVEAILWDDQFQRPPKRLW